MATMGAASSQIQDTNKPNTESSKPSSENHQLLLSDGIDRLSCLPFELLILVFLHLDVQSMIRCRGVCQLFHEVLSSKDFWHQVMRDRLLLSKTEFKSLGKLLHKWSWSQYAKLCLASPFGKNLIKNGSAQLVKEHSNRPHGYSGKDALKEIANWKILNNGGDGWQVERPPVGANPVPEDIDVSGHGCFVSSYTSCTKAQVIDLKKELGCIKMMDDVIPNIVVSEWCAGRWDCESEYKLCVSLLDKDRKVITEWTEEQRLGANHSLKDWLQVKHTFSSYGPGVRYIQYLHKCNDTAFWAGWYGAKTTGASVRLEVPYCLIPGRR